ncbi:MAG: hypothetical protein R8M37_00765 [Alphaproteobacteria bacterium]|nr:hypothetical protein [Alphaproteobacteria bacterium]
MKHLFFVTTTSIILTTPAICTTTDTILIACQTNQTAFCDPNKPINYDNCKCLPASQEIIVPGTSCPVLHTKLCAYVSGYTLDTDRCFCDTGFEIIDPEDPLKCLDGVINPNDIPIFGTEGIFTYSYQICVNGVYQDANRYACGGGTYGTCTNNSDSSTCTCTECPYECTDKSCTTYLYKSTSATPTVPNTPENFTGPQNITDCYLSSGTYKDQTGQFTISNNCYYE